MNRPLAIAALFFLTGILVSSYCRLTQVWVPLCVVALGLGCVLRARRDARFRIAAVALAFLGAGGVLWTLRCADDMRDPFSRVAERHHLADVVVEGQVLQAGLVTSIPDSVSVIVAVDHFALPGEPAQTTSGNVVVRWSRADKQLHTGDRVRIRGKLSATIGPVNPGVGGVESYYRLQGVHSLIATRTPQGVERIASGSGYSPGYWASRLRVALAAHLAEAMPEQILPFVLAVWLGERTGVTEQEFQSYVESGTAHILSVSGVHVSIIYFSANFVLAMVIRSRKTRAALGIALVLLYALMTGASTPCVRAALMVCIYLLAEFVDRDPDAPTALSIAALIFLAWNPALVFDSGFQLSFLSIASILVFSQPIQNGLDAVREGLHRLIRRGGRPSSGGSRTWEFLRAPLATTLSVQILPLPMAARSFHVVSLSAPFANALVIPLLTAVLWLCFAASILCWFWPLGAQVCGHAAWPAVSLIQRTAAWSRISCPVTTPTLLAVAFLWSGALLWLKAGSASPAPRKWFQAAFASGLLALAVVFWRPLLPESEIVFLDVGHGDAAFVHFPGGGVALIDAGDRKLHADYGTRVVSPFLLGRGHTHVDLLFISHPDSDHIGGALSVIERISAGGVVLGPHEAQSSLERALVARCSERGIPVFRTKQGDTWQIGAGRIEVLHPPADGPSSQEESRDENDNSLVLRVHFGNLTVLFPGDVEEKAESTLAKLDCKAGLLKVPHHGSITSSSMAFVRQVAPRAAVVSTGGTEGREPVDERVLMRYRGQGIPVWRTDYEGGIRVTYRGDAIHIEGERKVRGYPRPRDE